MYLTSKVVDINRSILNALNPLNYLPNQHTDNNNFNRFMDLQNDYVRADRSLYPFTVVNPYATWYQRLKLSIFGESNPDKLDRIKKIVEAESTLRKRERYYQ